METDYGRGFCGFPFSLGSAFLSNGSGKSCFPSLSVEANAAGLGHFRSRGVFVDFRRIFMDKMHYSDFSADFLRVFIGCNCSSDSYSYDKCLCGKKDRPYASFLERI